MTTDSRLEESMRVVKTNLEAETARMVQLEKQNTIDAKIEAGTIGDP